MQKFILLIIFSSIFSFVTLAQCTPGANYADSLFGAWPDTTTNFPAGQENVSYVTDLNFKVPSDAGDIDPAFMGNQIIDFTVDSVVGLPAGLDHACNIASCNYTGGSNGCAQILGVPTSTGMHDITIHITANLSFFGLPVPVPYSFSGYHIFIEPQGTANILETKFDNVSIYPNPAKDVIYLKELNQKMEAIEIQDASGKSIILKNSDLNELNISSLENGIYFIKIYFSDKQEAVRFVKF